MSHPFDPETVGRVAADHEVSESALESAADALQATLADHQGRTVDGLVYEWRQGFRGEPLVERTPSRWVLCVPERAWTDILDRASVSGGEASALRALHADAADIGDYGGVALVVART